MLRFLVTGANGFIGRNLVRALAAQFPDAQIVTSDIQSDSEGANSSYRAVDLVDRAAVRALVQFAAPTHVFHVGARTDLNGTSLSDYSANTTGVDNVVEALRGCVTLQRAVYFSSRLVCEIGHRPVDDTDFCPPNLYGASKVAGELLVREKAAGDWVIVRPTSIWGPGFGVPYRDFFDSVRSRRYVHPGQRKILKSFGYVDNVVHEVIKIAFAEASIVSGRVFYLCDYEPIDVLQFASRISVEFGRGRIRSVPAPVLRLAGVVGDGLRRVGWQNPPLTSFRVNNLLTEMLYDTANLAEVVGSLPVTLDSGVSATVAWMRREA